MSLINLTINGKAVAVEEGTNILEAAKKVNIKIPNLCYLHILFNISSNLLFPIRRGVHLPHDSSTVNSKKNLDISTIQSVSSRTSIPP
ncbi:MAG: 2Fe-2S iron-sulfur cluster-binding protein, partial [Intestinibacter bartlettii]